MTGLRAWPLPMCATCGAQPVCEARGTVEPIYPTCRVPIRPTDGSRLAALMDAWRRHDGDAGAEAAACERRALEGAIDDGRRYSEIFEPSLGWTRAGGSRLRRFSYAFPGFRSGPDAVSARILAIVAPFGEGASAVATRVLRAAKHPCIEQPLFGLACDGIEGVRLKLYLQFRDAAGTVPLSLVSRLLDAPDLASRVAGTDLHLACVDFAPSGRLVGAKLYFVHRNVDTRAPSTVPNSEALQALAASGVRSLADVLAIHRLASPNDTTVTVPRELDFGLVRNELSWRDVRSLAPLAPVVGDGTVFDELSSRFRLGVRRLTVSTGELTKLNVYYVLAERGTP